MKELVEIGKLLGLPLYVDVANTHPRDKERKAELATKVLANLLSGKLKPKTDRVRRPRKKPGEIPVLPGQTNIMEALENGESTRHGKPSVHGRISTHNRTIETETTVGGKTTRQRRGFRATAANKLPRADGGSAK